jgi:hypothetical protein
VPFQATKRERKRGRDLRWTLRGMPAPEWVAENWPASATILAVRCKGVREGEPIENSWHWPGVTQLKEDAHHYREPNGLRIQATLRSLAIGLANPPSTACICSPWACPL